MYNKLFTKILDSSIWLEPTPTRIVFVTLLAAMDEDGFCQFASPANVAHRAVVSLAEATTALEALEAPDPNSSDPSNEGRRIERIPGGWYVLNAPKYREIVSREESRRLHKDRQSRYRERKATKGDASVTPRDANVTPRDVRVTQSEAYTETEAETEAKKDTLPARGPAPRIPTKAENNAKAAAMGIDLPYQRPVRRPNQSMMLSHRSHSWCGGDRVKCVPDFVHNDVKLAIGGPVEGREQKALQWYERIAEEFTDQSQGEDAPAFWRNLLARDFTHATTKPTNGRDTLGVQIAKVVMGARAARGETQDTPRDDHAKLLEAAFRTPEIVR